MCVAAILLHRGDGSPSCSFESSVSRFVVLLVFFKIMACVVGTNQRRPGS